MFLGFYTYIAVLVSKLNMHCGNLRKNKCIQNTFTGLVMEQGCQIFLATEYQNGVKYTKLPQNIPNGHKIFPMAVK
jgi:hypothetical protein